jgi:hypothetical protein
MEKIDILIGCEESGVVTESFRRLGLNAWSCDLLETSGNFPEYHIVDDVFNVINKHPEIKLGIFFPPCTYLTVTGNKWMKPEFKDRFPDRIQQREDAIKFFMAIANAKCDKIAIENPVGIMSSVWRKPDQYVHPYYFGDPHSKKTGLWLKGLPKLLPTNIVEPEMYVYKDGRRDPIWHVESLRLSPDERAKVRSKTFQGFADAMANQWHNI